MSIKELVEISHFFGGADFVLAGGGNTSFKDAGVMCVKASGTSLLDIDEAGFVKMSMSSLSAIWEAAYPEDEEARESAVLLDLMNARLEGEDKRPSVEALLHALLPFKFVVHTHPRIVNGVTCSKEGAAAIKRLFQGFLPPLWIEETKPGYILAARVKGAVSEFQKKFGLPCSVIFLQNHGVFVGADSADEVKRIYDELFSAITPHIKRMPDFGIAAPPAALDAALKLLTEAFTPYYGTERVIKFMRNNEIARIVESLESFFPLSRPFTPDHIVYAGSSPVFFENADNKNDIEGVLKTHIEKTGRHPKIAAVKNLGVFGIGKTEKTADTALSLFQDAAFIARVSESFGGARFMADDKIDFINNWEVERYRSSVSSK